MNPRPTRKLKQARRTRGLIRALIHLTVSKEVIKLLGFSVIYWAVRGNKTMSGNKTEYGIRGRLARIDILKKI